MSDHVHMTEMNYDNDRPAAENPIKIMDLSLRDGHQSLFATRGRTEDMIPVAELMDEAQAMREALVQVVQGRLAQNATWQRARGGHVQTALA